MAQICLGWLAASAALLCGIFWAGCNSSQRQIGPDEIPPTPVTVMEVRPARIPIFSDFAAQTYARDMVEVRGRVEGYIEQWLFKPGSEVHAGQVLYVLDLRPYEAIVQQARGNLSQSKADLEFAQHQVSLLQVQANLASAEANLLKSQQDYERLSPLVAADAASKQDLDAAMAALKANEANVRANKAIVDQTALSTRTQIEAMKARVESQNAAVRTAELNLQYGTIRAPISGRIGDSLIPVGGLVTPSSAQPLTTIVPLDPIWVRFKVAESEYLSWRKRGENMLGNGVPLTLLLADNTELPSKGHIENSLNQVDPKTGTLELQARFPNPKHTILPGQFGRIRLQTDERANAIAVPQKAVQQLQNMQAIYTVGPDNKVQMRAVTTGYRFGSMWLIEQGLNPGERVIVEGQLKVRPGARVNPQPYRAAAENHAAGPKAGE
ncbi:MAG TPA: efflux RND transporter periplasmic adaptor subunit [Acidobacteriota bacterium]|nr:efflux RND transporter periplasmic adaptor subunit [Acidobacteriota bacterium]